MVPLQTLLLFFGLKDAFMDFGSAIMQPIYWAVSGLIVLFHNLWAPVFGHGKGITWVASIICLTIVIRTLLIPLFVKQINSSRDMQLIQPKVKALQEKYANDRERLGQETMALYREEGVNPMASCLPVLLQMPIFLALFRVLEGAARNPIIPRGHFFKQNPELVQSLHDATVGGAQLAGRFLPMTPFGANQITALVLILCMTAVLFIQQKELMIRNMPPEALTGPMAQQQKMMLYMFPVMYALGGIYIPIGVLIYWMTTNLWTLGQQFILIRNNPTPGTPAHVDWQERMRAKGKDPDKIEAERRAKRQKSRQAKLVTPAATPAASSDEGGATAAPRPGVARQQVTRQTVRKTSDGGRQTVQRQQPARQPRQARKKKKK
ncbi:membrane protein insertase YidC [Luteococcus sp. Sow4_B9]|uniref:membrane protein insertase YidC n=1 Tax=Luteococcus sp. Sow4_B9 TaxID=3438792 RepID=UPI003F9665E3